jgi:aromatic-amino-acid transaminase
MKHLIASHQSRPTDDPIFSLAREAGERAKRGESIVNATLGVLLDDDGKLAVLPTAARAVREVPEQEWAAYSPIAGSPEFLRAVERDLFADQPALRAAACTVATPGGSGALRHAIVNYLEPGHALLTTSFFWGPYQTLADEQDRKLRTFTMFDSKGAFDVDSFDKALGTLIEDQGRALVFLNDPCHNPTGYSMTKSEWERITACVIAHAERAPLAVLIDYAYAEYAAGNPRAFFGTLEPLLGKAALLFAWSASKSFTHYGLRVGALVCCEPDPGERAATDAALSYSSRGTWSNCSRGGIAAITRLLTDEKLAVEVTKEREALKTMLSLRVAAFNEHAGKAGLKYPRYEGGFFVTIFHDEPQKKAAEMKERGVFVVPTKGGLRCALCSVAVRDIPRLVEALR